MCDDEEEAKTSPITWMGVDFDKVKQRIDNITDKIEKAIYKFEPQVNEASNYHKHTEDDV